MKKQAEKITIKPNIHNTKHTEQYYMCSPTTQGKTQTLKSSQTQRSEYTSASKLTQCKLYKVLSRADLKLRNQQMIKIKDSQIQILNNTIDCCKINQKIFVFQMGQLFGKYAIAANKIYAEIGKCCQD